MSWYVRTKPLGVYECERVGPFKAREDAVSWGMKQYGRGSDWWVYEEQA